MKEDESSQRLRNPRTPPPLPSRRPIEKGLAEEQLTPQPNFKRPSKLRLMASAALGGLVSVIAPAAMPETVALATRSASTGQADEMKETSAANAPET